MKKDKIYTRRKKLLSFSSCNDESISKSTSAISTSSTSSTSAAEVTSSELSKSKNKESSKHTQHIDQDSFSLAFEKIKKVLKKRNTARNNIIQNNLEIGKIISESRLSTKEIIKLARTLTQNGFPVSPSFLIDAKNVYEFKIRKKDRTSPSPATWFEAVALNSVPPLGNTEEAMEFWNAEFEYLMKANNNIEFLLARIHAYFDSIPDSLKEQAKEILKHYNYLPSEPQPSVSQKSPAPQTISEVPEMEMYQNQMLYQYQYQYQGQYQEQEKREIKPVYTSFLHTGDLHFENDEFLEETIKNSNFIVQKAEEIKPDLIIIAGDTFHSRQKHDSPALRAAQEFYTRLANIAPLISIIGTKQHDGLSLKFLSLLKTRYFIYISEIPEILVIKNDLLAANIPVPVEMSEKTTEKEIISRIVSELTNIEKPQCLVFSFPPVIEKTPAKQKEKTEIILKAFQEIKKRIKEKFENIPVVFTGHGAVEGTLPDKNLIDYTVKELEQTADLIMLAHIHKPGIHGKKVFYCGSITRRTVDEIEDRGFWIHQYNPETKTFSSKFEVIPARQILELKYDHLPQLSDLPEQIPQNCWIKITYQINESEKNLVKEKEKEIKKILLERGASRVDIQKTVLQNHTVRARGISKCKTIQDKIKKAAECLKINLSDSILQKIELARNPKEELEKMYLNPETKGDSNA